jgi:hypothetical protein
MHNFFINERNKNYKNTELMNSLEWWHLISENICDNYDHSQEDDVYNETPKAFLT